MPHHLELWRNLRRTSDGAKAAMGAMAEVLAVRIPILPTKQVDYTPELATVQSELHVVEANTSQRETGRMLIKSAVGKNSCDCSMN